MYIRIHIGMLHLRCDGSGGLHSWRHRR